MRTYQLVGALIITAGLAFITGLKVGESRRAPAAASGNAACCAVPVDPAASTAPRIKIPTGSGRPCLVEFGSDECDACQRMAGVLREASPKLKGKVDTLQVDTDLYPAQAQRWRLRMVPTQILVDAGGQELWRHEGLITAQELLARIASGQSKPAAGLTRPTRQ